MMVREIASWSEFGGVVEEIRAEYGHIPYVGGRTKANLILFRGQSDHSWPLATTLERSSNEEFSLERYHWRAHGCLAPLESITGKRWPDWPRNPTELGEALRKIDPLKRVYPPGYSFVVYLRHHGFPSPLLDWSTSPYVAAYFAYAEKTDAERVAVFAYIETTSGGKGFKGGEPRITAEGPHVTTDPRHFTQKCWYTVATRYDETKKSHVYCSHMDIFDLGAVNQDVLWKITIPAQDRPRALQELEDYNIDHYTLFQTEDALVKSLATRQFDLEHP